jgi:hypothetical protein
MEFIGGRYAAHFGHEYIHTYIYTGTHILFKGVIFCIDEKKTI